jgi:hypothetical protein
MKSLTLALVAIAALSAGCGASHEQHNPIPKAYKSCGSQVAALAHPTSIVGQLSDPGKVDLEGGALSVSGVNSDEPEGVAAVDCTFDHLHTPAVLRTQINSTASTMGRQRATRNGLRYTWSYSDPSGLVMTVEMAK